MQARAASRPHETLLHPPGMAASSGVQVRNAMDPRDVARIVVLMASLPDEQNLLEAITLPLGMPFLGRG